MYFSIKKIKFKFFSLIFFDVIYFKVIKTAAFYQKKKMFRSNFLMFLDLKVSYDQNKNLSLGKTDY